MLTLIALANGFEENAESCNQHHVHAVVMENKHILHLGITEKCARLQIMTVDPTPSQFTSSMCDLQRKTLEASRSVDLDQLFSCP
jgi:hypothetical protein